MFPLCGFCEDHSNSGHSCTRFHVDVLDFLGHVHLSRITKSDSNSTLNFFLVFIYLRERERERAHARAGEGAERERDAESEVGSGLRAVSTEPDVGLEPTNCEIMT